MKLGEAFIFPTTANGSPPTHLQLSFTFPFPHPGVITDLTADTLNQGWANFF